MHLWKAGLPQNERKEILGRLEAILHTCRNSAFKHLKDGNVERLNWRIEEIRADLNELAEELVKDDLVGAEVPEELCKLHGGLRQTGCEGDGGALHEQPH